MTEFTGDFIDWLQQKLTDLGETQLLVGKGEIKYVKNMDPKRQYYIVTNAIKKWRQENDHLFGKQKSEE